MRRARQGTTGAITMSELGCPGADPAGESGGRFLGAFQGAGEVWTDPALGLRRASGLDSRVEEGRGIACATRFPSPLIKPDVRICRIRLSDRVRGCLKT
jgi:hypothetical protein